jgi:glycosyltransferase involved in cell wall biosynthesis
MKIAMIHSPILGRGGGERQILTLANELQKRGHTVEIFVSALNVENSYPELIKKLSVTVIPHPLGKKMPKWLAPQGVTEQETSGSKMGGKRSGLRSYMQQNVGRQIYTIPYELPAMLNMGRKIPKGFDIVNNHNYPSEWAAFAAKKRLNAPIVWMCNEPPFWFFVPELRQGLRKINWPVYSIVDRVAVDYIDEILVLSRVAEGYVREAYNRPSRVVRSGIDADRFSQATGKTIRERYDLRDDFVLLQVGNIELNKRQIDAVKALQILTKRHTGIKLVFDGGGRRDELVRLAEKLGVQDKVLFLRSSSDEELAEVYAACDAFLFPAQITWGLAVVEAMAAGKPVVLSEKCGASEIVQDSINGLLVEHAKPAEIARKVELLVNDGGLRRKLGENAREYVVKNLSWEKYAIRMEAVFERVKRRYD